MPSAKYLIVIGGPTASGKTALAIDLARHLDTEILSCDSRQFYQEMHIGTAKPSAAELAQVPHHFIDHLSITDPYSVGDFERDALDRLAALFEVHDCVVMVGGSGLYSKAVCEGLDEFPEVPPEVRRQVEAFYQKEGLSALQAELERVDPVYFQEVDRQNPHRLLRALAVCRAAGRPFSSFRTARSAPRPFTPVYLALHLPRAELYDRINGRVQQMLEDGLLAEARRLHPHRGLTALETVGYQELFDHFEGKQSLEEAVALIQRNSRRYAKRQLTWLRRDGHWKHVRPGETDQALAYLELVRREGLTFQQSPPQPLPAALLPAPAHEDKADYLVLANGEGRALALPRHSFKNFELLWPPRTAGHIPYATTLSCLWHEAAVMAGAPLYAVIPGEIEPFFLKAGFPTADHEGVPAEVIQEMERLGDSGAQKLFKF